MSRPTYVTIDLAALCHNLDRIHQLVPNQFIMADIIYQARQSKDTAVIRADCHLKFSDEASQNHNWLSLAVVVLSAFTGTAIVATLLKNQDFTSITTGDKPINWFDLVAACLSILTIVLSCHL